MRVDQRGILEEIGSSDMVNALGKQSLTGRR